MRRTTINLTEATDRQIEYLGECGYGSFSKIVRLAIDRMYREEVSEVAKYDHDPVATKSVRQYGGSDTGAKPMGEKPVDMRVCGECGREYNALQGPCKHGKD